MSLGSDQIKLLQWLENNWVKDEEASVCVIEGFSGLGKTTLARQLQGKITKIAGFKAVYLTLPDRSFSFDDFFLELAAELSTIGIFYLEEAITGNKPLIKALQNILQLQKVFIFIDDFQNILADDGHLPNDLRRLIEGLSMKNTVGKLLLLTNQVIHREKWSDHVVFKTFPGLSNTESIHQFNKLLEDSNINLDIDEDRKIDIINVLGKNPRAMRTFVQCLRWGTLDELIGESPELWEARDRELSARLLLNLEETLIKKSIERFDKKEIQILKNLAVLRKPFKKEAIERMNISKEEATSFRDKYTQYYFLENNAGWFNLNPVLKEVCKYSLSESKPKFRLAHGMAAEYYTRHFFHAELKAIAKLGGYFVEARYHLLMAESQQKLTEISHNFEYFIRATVKSVSPIPNDPQLLNERIALLTAYLGSGGPKGLEYHLAKCLEDRGLKNDLNQALLHVGRAIGLDTPPEAWLIKIRLEEKINGILTAINTAYQAIERTPPNLNLCVLYKVCAELLDKNDQIDEAIRLLKEGIGKIPVNNNLFVLYQACAELMDKNCQTREAISLLKNGINSIDASNSVVSLYQVCAELLYKNNQLDDAILLLKDGINKIPVNNNVSSLYQACAELMDKNGQFDDAIRLLKDGINKIPVNKNLFIVYQACAGLFDKSDQTEEAILLLKDGINKIDASNGVSSLYQSCAELMEKKDGFKEAILLLKDGIIQVPLKLGGIRILEQAIFTSYRYKNVADLVIFSNNAENKIQSLLSQILKNYAEGNFAIDSELDRTEWQHFPTVALGVQVVFGLLTENRLVEAKIILEELKIEKNVAYPGNSWLAALSAIKNKDFENAEKYFKISGKPVPETFSGMEKELVRIWWETRVKKGCPAYHYPHLPAKLMGYKKELSIVADTIVEDVSLYLNDNEENEKQPIIQKPNILCVATEWFSRNGGLSSFNRQLCFTLAERQYNVYCFLPSFSSDEETNAVAGGVRLIAASVGIGMEEIARLNLKPVLPDEFLPDIIIGHDRITGPAMTVLRRDFFPASKTALFIHTSPGEIEWYKPVEGIKNITQKADERERIQLDLAKQCDLVVAVGPKLRNEMSTQLSGIPSPPPITTFNPGVFDYDENVKEVSPIPFCLLLGRVEDFDLKGVDIAAKSLDLVYKNMTYAEKPVFLVRGAVSGTGDELRQRIKTFCSSALEVRIKEYNADEEVLKEDIRRASIVLMPSRTEGFGLVGLEAISMNCPVLISDNSGLAKLLEHEVPGEAHNWIVRPTGDDSKKIEDWAKKIEFILNDRAAANARIKRLSDEIRLKISWDDSLKKVLSYLPLGADSRTV